MSGIAGVYYLDGRPVDRADVQRMGESLAHRGPDGAGVWNTGPVGLAHRMLRTTPESLDEHQPLVSSDGALVLTADARIDNRQELIATLDLGERRSPDITDSQLILAAYETWGEACPERLIGDFAFVVWDDRRQVLFCARDHFGIRPLYYFHQPGRAFAFASEIRALLGLPSVPRRLNEVKVAYYLASLEENQVSTFYHGVMRLPPAHRATIGREGSRFEEYWSVDPKREIRYGSDEAYAEAFREIFTEAVRCRVRSAFPVGASLSGGLDSSSVVCVARQLLAANGDRPLQTFSAVFDDIPECDERSFINTILVQDGLEPHYVYPDRLSALTDVERMLWHQEQPFHTRNLFLLEALYGAAQKQGVRIMLDGLDGDTVVSHGFAALAELARTGRWESFAREAEAFGVHFQNYGFSPKFLLRTYGFPYLTELARTGRWVTFARAVNGVARHCAVSRRQLVLNQGLKPLAPEPVRRVWRSVRGRERTSGGHNPLIAPGLAERTGFRQQYRALLQQYTPVHTLREEHWRGLSKQDAVDHEERNKAAGAYAIETRHPFWDRRLVEFCLALPAEQKLRDGWPRWILRRAMDRILPEAVQWRVGKSNLAQNFARSLLTFERERLEELLVQAPKVIEAYVDVSALHHAYRRGEANMIWPPVILALWLRRGALHDVQGAVSG